MRQLRAVDLFCGAGGFAHGMQSAGIKIIRSLDHDPAMIDIHRANISNVERSPLVIRPPKTELDEGNNAESHRGGIHKSYKRHHVADLQTVLEIAPELAMEKPDIVFGGPPCQPFANIGNRKGDTSPLSLLTEAFAIFVATARPTYFVMENVKAFVSRKPTHVQPLSFAEPGMGSPKMYTTHHFSALPRLGSALLWQVALKRRTVD